MYHVSFDEYKTIYNDLEAMTFPGRSGQKIRFYGKNIDHIFENAWNDLNEDEHTGMLPEIKNVIFSNPATIVFWKDGTKTVVKAYEDEFDAEKGLTMAITKKALGNRSNYYDVVKRWVGDLMPGGEDSCKKARKAEVKKSKNKK